jgi:hypothetical protein
MPIKVKDPAASSAKYVQNAGNAVNAYKAGVQAPKQSQSAAAIAAVPLWQQAVASPAAAAAMKAGLNASGDQGWMSGALNKGAARYPQGVQLAQGKWQTNTQPYLTLLASQNLPAKGIRGAAQNYQRVQAVGQALHNLKQQRAGAPAGS